MPAYNFGMLTAGLPDMAQRQVSAPVQDATYLSNQNNQWLSDWQGRWDAATPIATTSGAGNNFWDVYNPGNAQSAIESAIAAGTDVPGLTWSEGVTTYDDSARRALDAEKAQHLTQYQQSLVPLAQNQQTQQSAYDQSNGGTFNGGIINASYGTPFGGNTDATNLTQVDGVTMPQNQPWGMAGYGGPTGAQSQGGFGGSGWGQGGGSQPQGWGGPFTNKNPWAAS